MGLLCRDFHPVPANHSCPPALPNLAWGPCRASGEPTWPWGLGPVQGPNLTLETLSRPVYGPCPVRRHCPARSSWIALPSTLKGLGDPPRPWRPCPALSGDPARPRAPCLGTLPRDTVGHLTSTPGSKPPPPHLRIQRLLRSGWPRGAQPGERPQPQQWSLGRGPTLLSLLAVGARHRDTASGSCGRRTLRRRTRVPPTSKAPPIAQLEPALQPMAKKLRGGGGIGRNKERLGGAAGPCQHPRP